MAYNLYGFVDNAFTKNATFNLDKWYKIVYEGTRLGDNLVDLEAEYIDRIINKIKSDPEPDNIKNRELELWIKSKIKCLAGRRTGMGITALGDTLAALGLKYDSTAALDIIRDIFYTKMKAELDSSIDMSITRGSFMGWNPEIEYPTIQGAESFGNSFYKTLRENYPEQVDRMKMYGRRNTNISTIAPTGSVSILTQTSSGIEPLFQPYYTRRKKVNPGDKDVRVDFVDQVGDSWQEFFVLHPKFKDWYKQYVKINREDFTEEGFDNTVLEHLDKDRLQRLFEQSPWFNSTANDIDWVNRVKIQSILQSYTTNAISSTINLPSTVTTEEVSDIYMYGWKAGLKGQTVKYMPLYKVIYK